MTMSNLCGPNLTAEGEYWIKITPPREGPYSVQSNVGESRVKLKGAVREVSPETRTGRPKPIALKVEIPGKNSKCPYLRRLAKT